MLVVPREEAATKLSERASEGQKISGRSIKTEADLDRAESDFYTWSEYNARLLERLFNNRSEADRYGASVSPSVVGLPLHEQINFFRRDVSDHVRHLQSLARQLDLIPVAAKVRTIDEPSEGMASKSSNKVFVVHGHDEKTRETVARFIMQLKMKPIILAEQASGGRTLTEHFEHHSDVAFAVVLFSPDDVGTTKASFDAAVKDAAPHSEGLKSVLGVLEPRARQNVVFELGFFYGKLSHSNVCVLLSGGLSDLLISRALSTLICKRAIGV